MGLKIPDSEVHYDMLELPHTAPRVLRHRHTLLHEKILPFKVSVSHSIYANAPLRAGLLLEIYLT